MDVKQDNLNRLEYVKNTNRKRDFSNCIYGSIFYLFLSVFFFIALIVIIWLVASKQFEQDPSLALSSELWEFLIFPIVDLVVLEIISIYLLIKTKKIEREYQEETKNLWIWYLVGIFIIIPSFVASVIVIIKFKKTIGEIEKSLRTNLNNRK